MNWVELAPSDAHYPPAALSITRVPPTLYTTGNIDLLGRPAVSICGSRAASESALKYAKEFGSLAVAAGFVVVSGHAKGVDRAAHLGAMEAGGATIAILPEGARHFKPAPELRRAIDSSNFLAVSQFEMNAPWTVFRAMNRNKYIVALTEGLFVVESRERGGTFQAGLECLRQRKRLLVVEFADGADESRRGNRLLIERGGRAVRTPRQLKAILKEAAQETTLPCGQQLLAL